MNCEPRPRVDAAVAVGHHKDVCRSLQGQRERRGAGRLQQGSNVQVLRVGQHAAPGVSRTCRPRVQYLGEELEDALLPRMADEQVAVQAIRVSHQSPAHLACFLCHRHDVLLVDRVDAGPVQLVRALKVVRAVIWPPNLASLDGAPYLLPQIPQVCTCDAPLVRCYRLMQSKSLQSGISCGGSRVDVAHAGVLLRASYGIRKAPHQKQSYSPLTGLRHLHETYLEKGVLTLNPKP